MTRLALAASLALFAAASLDTAQADPYRWCSDNGGRTGGTNCWFMTLEQCRAAISGMTTGTCRPNPFYNGAPIGGVGPSVAPRVRQPAARY
jgi:uncharacterized protein DUF3551